MNAPRLRHHCIVPGCQRTKTFTVDDQYVPIWWACDEHWLLVPQKRRDALLRLNEQVENNTLQADFTAAFLALKESLALQRLIIRRAGA